MSEGVWRGPPGLTSHTFFPPIQAAQRCWAGNQGRKGAPEVTLAPNKVRPAPSLRNCPGAPPSPSLLPVLLPRLKSESVFVPSWRGTSRQQATRGSDSHWCEPILLKAFASHNFPGHLAVSGAKKQCALEVALTLSELDSERREKGLEGPPPTATMPAAHTHIWAPFLHRDPNQCKFQGNPSERFRVRTRPSRSRRTVRAY